MKQRDLLHVVNSLVYVSIAGFFFFLFFFAATLSWIFDDSLIDYFQRIINGGREVSKIVNELQSVR